MTETQPQSTVKQKKGAPAASTQIFLNVSEIKDNVLVLKNGGLRAVLQTSSINFNLKSEQEQNAIIFGYQSFLNSIDFPIQILVHSRKLDIDKYIDNVRVIAENQENPLLKKQTNEYCDYIQKLVEYADIMEKEFYVIVPYDPGRSRSTSIFQSFFQRLSPKDSYSEIKKRHNEFNQLKKSLSQRVNIVISGLENCGLKVDQLETSEIIELFYNSYNPNLSRSSKAKKVDELNIDKEETEEI